MARGHILSDQTSLFDLAKLNRVEIMRFAFNYGEQAGLTSEAIEEWRILDIEDVRNLVMTQIVVPIQKQLKSNPTDKDTLAEIRVIFRDDTIRPAVCRQELAKKGLDVKLVDGALVVKVTSSNIAASTAALVKVLEKTRTP